MSEPILRRQILTEYTIRTSKCEDCGTVYFPPKIICDVEGRESKMETVDRFYDTGKLRTASMVRTPTNKFNYLGQFLVGIIDFDDVCVPARITDFYEGVDFNPNDEFDISLLFDHDFVPRFRRSYEVPADDPIPYSSLAFSKADGYCPYQKYQIVEPKEKGRIGGIVGYGAYLPRLRIKNPAGAGAGIEERCVAGPDEDAVTMGVEATKRALIHAAIDSSSVKMCDFGTESSPDVIKGPNATVIQALKLGPEFEGGFFSGGTGNRAACKAATDKYSSAISNVMNELFDIPCHCVIGADTPQAAPGDPLDYTVSDGAVSFIFGTADIIAAPLKHAFASYTSDTPDFWRRDGQKYPKHGGRFTGDPAYYKHIVTAGKEVLKRAGLQPKDIDDCALHTPNLKFPQTAARQTGLDPEQCKTLNETEPYVGNFYAGASPLQLAAALDIAKPGELILLVSYGSTSGSDAFVFEVKDAIEEKRHRLISVREQIKNPEKKYIDYSVYRKLKEMK